MEAALCPTSEPSRWDSAPSTSTSVQSAPPALGFSQHRSPLPMPKNCQKKKGSPAPSKKEKGALGKGASSGHMPTLELHWSTAKVGPPLAQPGIRLQLLGVVGDPGFYRDLRCPR